MEVEMIDEKSSPRDGRGISRGRWGASSRHACKGSAGQYVKICSLYGDGFYYIPGTDTCLKMGGYLRVQAEYNMGGGGVPVGDSAGGRCLARVASPAT